VRELGSPDEVAQVAARFPNSSIMQRRRLAAALRSQDAAAALDAAGRLAAMGAALSAAARRQVEPLVGAARFAPIAARFDANVAPLGSSTLYATIPATHRLIEGLIWDGRRRQLYATSVIDRRLLRLVPPERADVALEGGVGSLLGGAYDRKRDRLWIASALLDGASAPPGFSGLAGFEPGRGRTLRIPLPAGTQATLGDVAVAADGTVYASDGLTGAVYRCRPGCAALEPFLAAGTLYSAQGMAFSPDGRRLYIADYRYGLAVADPASGRLMRVSAADDVMLDGIDGLVAHGRDLIAIQSGVAPVRIVRLVLSPDGLGVARLEVLERGNPAWGEPTLGAVLGDRLLYAADPQWDRFENGRPVPGRPSLPTTIHALKLP
jgi:hypothetical protein